MTDNDLERELLSPPIQINITVRTELLRQGIGPHFRGFAIVTAECGNEQKSWMMLPGPYDGQEESEQWEEVKARWRAQLDWIRHHGAGPALSLAEDLIGQAYRDDEGVNSVPKKRKLQYSKRQANRVKEQLPERKRFWQEARRSGLVNREGIWPSLIEAFDATVSYKSSRTITKPKWKSGQIALVHAAMDAGIILGNRELLSMEQWRTLKRELVDREG